MVMFVLHENTILMNSAVAPKNVFNFVARETNTLDEHAEIIVRKTFLKGTNIGAKKIMQILYIFTW